MKKLLLLIFCLALVGHANAQKNTKAAEKPVAAAETSAPAEASTLTAAKLTSEDLMVLLNSSGKFLMKYDLVFSGKEPGSMEIIMEEYNGRDSVKTIFGGFGIGGLRKDDGSMKSLLVGIDRTSDTTATALVRLGGEGAGCRLALKRILATQPPLYGVRPFTIGEIKTGEKIPVLLYASYFVDPESAKTDRPYLRFCGSSEVDREMTDELFDLCPHYYIVSVRFR